MKKRDSRWNVFRSSLIFCVCFIFLGATAPSSRGSSQDPARPYPIQSNSDNAPFRAITGTNGALVSNGYPCNGDVTITPCYVPPGAQCPDYSVQEQFENCHIISNKYLYSDPGCSNGNTTTIYTYDSNGQLTKTTSYDYQNNINLYIEYTYSSQQRSSKEYIKYGSAMKLDDITIDYYDNDNNIVRTNYYDSNNTLTAYLINDYSSGLLSKSTYYDSKGTAGESEAYTYNNGMLTGMTIYMPPGVLLQYIDYQYNSDNTLSRINTYDSSGNSAGCSAYQYSNSVQEGSLKVTISPSAAVVAGATWDVDGGSWQNSGATVPGLSVGQHTISFSNLQGWTTPGPQTVTVSDGQVATASGAYVEQTGGLWQNATATGGGWYYLSPFGAFNTNGSPWIYHQTLGWLYPVGTSTDSIWFYDPQWDGTGGWWWTSSSFFPWVFSVPQSAWLYFDAKDSSAGTRWFFNTSGVASAH